LAGTDGLYASDDAPDEPESAAARIRASGMVRFNGLIRTFILAGLFGTAAITPGAGELQDTLSRFTYTEYHMGMDARIVVYAANRELAERACGAAFARIAELDSIMSDYRKDSELMRLCAQAGGGAVRISRDLFRVLKRSVEVSEHSEGAFDVTVGPLIQLWRAARREKKLPDPSAIEEARQAVGWRMLVLDSKAGTARLLAKGMRLDLGGIAKGDAADQAQRVLKSYGLTKALVELGGDIVVSGAPPGTNGWTVRVPNAGASNDPVDLKFANVAVSTSGDTEQFVVIDGVQYSHVVDPRTGQALTNRVQSTVVASIGLTSDPLSTALTVLDADGRTNLLRRYPGAYSYIRELRPKQ
jgi:thiamine biosynthesis lipoprotein